MPDASTIDPAAPECALCFQDAMRGNKYCERCSKAPSDQQKEILQRVEKIEESCKLSRETWDHPATHLMLADFEFLCLHLRTALADTRRVDDLEALVRESSRSVGIRLYDPNSDRIAIGFTFNRSFRYHDAKAPTLRDAIDDGIKLFRAADPFELDSDAAMAATPRET